MPTGTISTGIFGAIMQHGAFVLRGKNRNGIKFIYLLYLVIFDPARPSV